MSKGRNFYLPDAVTRCGASMIPYSRQAISEDDIKAVIDVLNSDNLTQGPAIPRFESAVTDYCGVRYAVAMNSGTSALHIACMALDVGPGDFVWTSPNTFVASANCARYCGAMVDFVDIDPVTYNMSADRLSEKLLQAEREGKLPKVVIPVHFSGQPCDMAAIHALSKKYGFRIIEDAAHAIGASYKGNKIGDCTYSDITVFSFHPVKLITTGEGGVATTGNTELAEKMRMARSHGITRNLRKAKDPGQGSWYYEQQFLGMNYRMTDIQAALGASQIKQLDHRIAILHDLADRYDKAFDGLPLRCPTRFKDSRSALHLYVIQVDRRLAVYDAMRAAGIIVNVHYIPVHTQPYYQSLGFKPGDYPVAEQYYSRALTIPLYSAMTYEQQDFVIDQLKSLCR